MLLGQVWNIDPITRGLKHYLLALPCPLVDVGVWNIDPITRGLKPIRNSGRAKIIRLLSLEY